jgi:hypothetical protein
MLALHLLRLLEVQLIATIRLVDCDNKVSPGADLPFVKRIPP